MGSDVNSLSTELSPLPSIILQWEYFPSCPGSAVRIGPDSQFKGPGFDY